MVVVVVGGRLLYAPDIRASSPGGGMPASDHSSCGMPASDHSHVPAAAIKGPQCWGALRPAGAQW